jgi:hypothetical protein
MLESVFWGSVRKLTQKFKVLVHVTRPSKSGRSVFKLDKIHTKSENNETCRGVMLSHVEAMIKIWESLEQVVGSDAQNPDISTHVYSKDVSKYLFTDSVL